MAVSPDRFGRLCLLFIAIAPLLVLRDQIVASALGNMGALKVSRAAVPIGSYKLQDLGAGRDVLGRSISYLESALRWDPALAPAYRNLARAYLLQGEFSNAERAAQDAVTADPDSALNWLLLARAQEQQGRWSEAVTSFAQGHARTGKADWTEYLLRARAFYKKHDWEEALCYYQKAIGTVDAPKDALLAEFDEYLIDYLDIQYENVRAETRLQRAKLLLRHGHKEGAEVEFEALLRLPRIDSRIAAEAHYYLALLAREGDQSELANLHARKAVAVDPKLARAYALLRQLLITEGNLKGIADLERAMPEFEPEYRVEAKLSDEWVLAGYDLDELQLAIGTEIDATLYWRHIGSNTTENASPQRVGQYLLEMRRLRNLVPNGGFQWCAGKGQHYPFGWSATVYTLYPGNYQIVLDNRYGADTRVAGLLNHESSSSGLASSLVEVEPGQSYLLAGWVRSENGNGYLGWRLERVTPPEDSLNYVAKAIRQGEWTYFAGVLHAPANVDHVRVLLLNFRSTGEVLFDNVLFTELRSPSDYRSNNAEQ